MIPYPRQRLSGGAHATQGTARQRPDRPLPRQARSDHRPQTPSREARPPGRMAHPRDALRRRLQRWARTTAPAHPPHGRPGHPQAHLQPLGRTTLRTMAGEPLFPALLRRGVLLPPAALRALLDDALAPENGRGTPDGAAAGELGRGHPHGCGQAGGLSPGGGGHHGPGEGGRVPDRCQAHAPRLKDQRRHERGRKVYSLHAPEVEGIGKGKAHKPYEFGVKVSVATPLHRCRGGQFVAHVKALPGNPYDGHTLATIIPAIEICIGAELERAVTDAGYKGHKAPAERRLRVYVAGQKRGVTQEIKRAFRRRSAIEPVIGHTKGEHRMGRNYLSGSRGDAITAVLAAVGYNFSLLLRWLALLCVLIRLLFTAAANRASQPQAA